MVDPLVVGAFAHLKWVAALFRNGFPLKAEKFNGRVGRAALFRLKLVALEFRIES
jgi:hypothetical protein